ncbi:MAG: ABC transporter ATP-binding protein [candidate division Zixibacteria bacterium]
MSSLIELQNLTRSFDGETVLESIDLTIKKGEAVVVIGQSGTGKSVLLKHLIGLLYPDSGDVLIDDVSVNEMNHAELIAMRQRFGMLFQSAALFDSMTVEENVGLGLIESADYDSDQVAEMVGEKLEMVGLGSSGDKYPSELSGGMRKRVGLARAIANDPEILLYDEPTTGLDPITADMINNLIVQLNERLHVTSIAVTHDMTSAYKIGNRIVMLHDGRIAFDGSPDEIRATNDATVKQFITGQATGPIQAG